MKTGKKKRHIARNIILIALAALIVGFASYKVITGYISSLPKFSYVYGNNPAGNMAEYPDTSFAVMSDLHYYDTSLGTSGSAYEACLNSDRKLLKESGQLLKTAVDTILNSGVRMALVCGDLTKDGELINHQNVVAQLQRLTAQGIEVFVVPGNHDVSNPGAVQYDGDTSTPVQNVSPEDFAAMYADFGYQDAILRDQNSLSYVAEPQEGLWIVAVDTLEYEANQPGVEEVYAGEVTQDQLSWLEAVFKQANDKGKAVILLEHHGVVEHWKGQSKLHPEYLLSDYKYVQKFYASYGVRLAFTGHYHAQDISLFNNGGASFIYDIETGSLSTPTCPIRFCAIAGNSIAIRTQTILDSLGADAVEPALAFVRKTIYIEAYNTLREYKVSEAGADYIANVVSDAFLAHYNGDENPTERVPIDKSKLSLWDRFIYSQYAYVVDGMWQDLPPADTTVTLSLSGVS
jgi:hypothetical protein